MGISVSRPPRLGQIFVKFRMTRLKTVIWACRIEEEEKPTEDSGYSGKERHWFQEGETSATIMGL